MDILARYAPNASGRAAPKRQKPGQRRSRDGYARRQKTPEAEASPGSQNPAKTGPAWEKAQLLCLLHKTVEKILYAFTKKLPLLFRETVTLPLDFCFVCGILRNTVTSKKEAIRMFKWFQELVGIRYQELSRLRRELRHEADK